MHGYPLRLTLAASFITSVAYGVILTLPLYLTRSLGYEVALAGRVVSCGIIGILASIVLIPRLLRRWRSSEVAAAGALTFLLAVVLILTGERLMLYLAGMLTGLACGLVYTLGPVLVSEFSSSERRAHHFSYITGLNVLGVGIAPATVRLLERGGLSHGHAFYLALLASLVAALLFYSCRYAQNLPAEDAETSLSEAIVPISSQNGAATIPPTSRIAAISRKSWTLALMVLLSGCVFSSMIGFQTLMASARGLDFSWFYLPYTAAVLVSRFTLTGLAERIGRRLAIGLLLALMVVAVTLFLWVSSNVLYLLPSLLLGLSYGLSYPLILAESVSDSHGEAQRKQIITLLIFGYNLGLYGFPWLFSLVVERMGFDVALVMLAGLTMVEFVCALALLRDCGRRPCRP